VKGRPVLTTCGDDGTARVWLWDPDSQARRGPLVDDYTTPLQWGRSTDLAGRSKEVAGAGAGCPHALAKYACGKN
jgi:hypothetical protein